MFYPRLFPLTISKGASGGPRFRTAVFMSGGGYEERDQKWSHARRRYDVGVGIKTLNDLATVLDFFHEMRGRAHSFLFRDRADWKSCLPENTPSNTDQILGTGDGSTQTFQLVKLYGSGLNNYTRSILTPVAGSVKVAVGGVSQTEGVDFTVSTTTGIVTFTVAPAVGLSVTAGFEFNVPVRFDTDRIELIEQEMEYGQFPSIPIVEVRRLE